MSSGHMMARHAGGSVRGDASRRTRSLRGRALAGVLALGLAAAVPVAHAQAPSKDQPSTPQVEARLKGLSDELRCLVCQNQTLADSHADLAIDLRNQVRSLLDRGMTDDEVKRYLVDRYGDFVLYRPPVQGNTWLLWFGPFGLLALGALVWMLVSRRSRRLAAAGGPGVAAPTPSDAGRGPVPVSAADARKLLDD